MAKAYLTVSVSGDVGKFMHEYLESHRNRFPTVVSFLDEAVLEKLDKEVENESKLEQQKLLED